MEKRHAGARTLQQVLEQAPSLALLQAQIKISQACFAAITPIIPVAMRRSVRAGPIDPPQKTEAAMYDSWVVLANNTAVATKLRQLQPLFKQRLEQAGWHIKEIKIQVIPHSA